MLVVKIGGSVRDPQNALREVSSWHEPVVVVHGASRELDELAERLGTPSRIVASHGGDTTRYTDSQTMDLFLMAYAGKVNKRIVEQLRRLGANAIGLTGLDGGIVRGRRRPDLRIADGGRTVVLHDNHVGSIERVDTWLLRTLIDAGCTPVLAPPIAGEEGTALNVDGDRLAAEVAVALRATHLVILADTPGLLRDTSDTASQITSVSADDIDVLTQQLGGRVRTKLRAAARARAAGVDVVIADGTVERPIARALAGDGTRLSPSG